MRRLACAAVLALVPVLLGGCVFAVGGGDRSDDRRMTRLEERITRAENQLGIPHEAAK